MPKFQTYCHAKCILSGEHTVLHNGGAIVLPLRAFGVRLTYMTSSSKLQWHFTDMQQNTLEFACDALEDFLKKNFGDLTGYIHIQLNVLCSAGLGASASLSVVISKLLAYLKKISVSSIFETARSLENIFHGKSSGVDIAGVMHDDILFYQAEPLTIQPFKASYQPLLYLSYSGESAQTKSAIEKIQNFRLNNASLAHEIDASMKQATHAMHQALMKGEQDTFKEAMIKSSECFERWGLSEGKVKTHLEFLKSQGALACKPTGSGNGGYVLSLWEDDIKPKSLQFIPVFSK